MTASTRRWYAVLWALVLGLGLSGAAYLMAPSAQAAQAAHAAQASAPAFVAVDTMTEMSTEFVLDLSLIHI